MRVLIALLSVSASAQDAAELVSRHCTGCHGAAKVSGLDLRTRESLLKGGSRGNSPDWIVKALRGDGLPKMPPGKESLSEQEIAAIEHWLQSGAEFGQRVKTDAPTWWSFRPVHRPDVPGGASHPIDAFIRKKLREKGLRPSPPASKAALIRRASFDLHGLPPSPEEIDRFLQDDSPGAWENLIDRLLASPRYGERWGRHWLDVVRYADTGGFENDLHYANAFRYRDYVIQSFNSDKPFDRFVQEQIAGDEIWPDNLDLAGIYELAPEKKKHLEARIGTGLYTIGSWIPAAGLIPEYLRSEKLADMVDVTGAAFLGLTFGCARCHDHKFDPIPQRDYYRLAAVFAASEDREIPIVDIMRVFDYQKHGPRVIAMNDLRAAIKAIDAVKKKRDLTDEEKARRRELMSQLAEAYLDYPGPTPTANVLAHAEKIPDIHVEIRGDYKNKGEKVGPGLPSFAGETGEIHDPHPFHTERRKALALWIASPDHPLTARVIVNRVWQGHFGWGVVRTPNDFGRQGEPPTHPELLDWLASEFVREGWSLKKLHRLVMTSETYRQANGFAEKDVENRLLSHMSRRRLDAESIRDGILSVSGALNLEMYGPAVAPPLSDEEMDGNKDDYKWPTTVRAEQANRRSIYLYVKRAFRFPFFEIFDAPDPAQSCARRESTNVPPQALALLNNKLTSEQSRVFANRLRKERPGNLQDQIALAWRLAVGRWPDPFEAEKSAAIVSRGSLEDLCLAMFNLNEFLYVD